MAVAIVPRVRLLAVFAVLAACTGNLQEKPSSTLDASPLSGIAPPTCDPPATPTDGTGDCTGGGMPGDDCLSCHHQTGAGIPFTFAGTLYDMTGTTPVGGATIYVEDAVGNVDTAISHSGNGNFYSTTGFVTYPARAFTSLCPGVGTMVSPVDQTTGANCNTAGCHSAGFRVYVP